MKALEYVKKRARAAAGFFRKRIDEVSCLSVAAGRSYTLPGQWLETAEEVRIAFTIEWALFSFPCREGVSVCLTPGADTQENGECQPKAAELTVQQWTEGRKTRVEAWVDGKVLSGWEELCLEVRKSAGGKRLCGLQLEKLDLAKAQELRIGQLRAVAHRLWVESDNQRHLAEQVADSTDFLVPEFVLAESELSGMLPPLDAGMELTLWGGDTRLFSQKAQARLDGRLLTLKGSPVAVRGNPAFRGAGPYRVTAALRGKELASFQFRIIEVQEWLRQLTVRLCLEAESLDGRSSLERGALRWDKHAGFRPCLDLETAIPAPNNVIGCVVSVLLGDTVLQSEEFVLNLQQNRRQERLRPYCLADLGLRLREKRVRLRLRLEMGARLQFELPVVILPSDRVTNFEGQLSRDPRTACVDEDAYQDILTNLVQPKPSSFEQVARRRPNDFESPQSGTGPR